jgi:hypothetical protein
MAATEEQINAARRRLGVVISLTHGYVSHAAQLLERKATRSPATAEATAHALLLKAKWELEAWLRRSGELLGETLPPEIARDADRPTPDFGELSRAAAKGA